MNAFATLIGQYNATALTLADADFGTIALDSKSRVLINHGTSSFRLGNGNETTPLFLDILEWDTASVGDEKGLMPLGVYKSTPTNLADTDGDFVPFQFDGSGRLRVDAEVSVTTGSDKVEDEAHSSGDVGAFILGVRNDSNTVLTSANGDYSPISVDSAGRIKTVAEISENGTDADVGVDEAGDGEIDVAYHASNFVDMASIAVGAGSTLFIKAFHASCDVLTEFRLAVYDDTTLQAIIRKMPVTENLGANEWEFPRSREVTGGATISVKLQGRCLRAGKTAKCGGGINAYIA